MKFSKLLTTAMMSVALVASSSAFAAEETPWWSMNFDGLTVAEGSSLTNTLNTAYGTTQKGVWSTEEGDLSSLADGKLVLNTQGTDLTWTPNGDNNTSLITYIDADVTFVGSDTAPTISETDVHTAVYLKNIVDDTTGEVTNSVLCAWGRPGTITAEWVELAGVEIEDEETYRLRIMLDGINLSFFIDGTQLTTTTGATKIETAKDGAQGAVDSVSFRGTGSVDNFAASQEAKEELGVASFAAYSVFEDMVEVTDSSFYLGEVYLGDLTLNGDTYPIVQAWDYGWDGDGNQLGAISAIKVTSATKTFEVVYVDGAFTENEAISIEATDQGELGTQYIVSLDSSALVADEEYTLEVYYGEYTPSEEPDPDPVKLGTPSVTATTTANSVTLTWTAVANASSYDVTFNNGTTTNVTETTFTASDLTASTDYPYSVVAKGDGENYTDSEAATGTATTAAAPAPVQLGTPSVTATTTANSVTLTWDAVANATGYEVTFNGEKTTVTDATFKASDLTASTDYSYSVVAKGDGENYTDSEAATGTATTAAAEVEPDPITIAAISGPVDGNVVVTVVPAEDGGKIKAGVNYWAVVSATLGGDETAQEPVTVDADTDSLEITVPATGDSLFIKVKADTATAE